MKVVLHCSDSSWGNAAVITKWHVLPPPNGRGWSTIGYHYVILNGRLSADLFNKEYDGHIETGRPLDDDNIITPNEFGAHVAGYNDTVGICLIGESGKFTSKQKYSVEYLIRMLRIQFFHVEVVQHSDLDPVNKPFCAGLDTAFMNYLNKEL